MPLFEKAIPIKAEEIQKIVHQNWKLKLGKLIKASQNHTFEAFSEDGQKYSVRVTPDPQGKHIQRITDELFFVQYLVKGGLKHLCSPIAPQSGSVEKPFLLVSSLIIAVFEWALGSALPFMEFRWMKDSKVIRAWGRFFAQLHRTSKQFGKQHPQVVKRIQKWDEIHGGMLKGVKLHPQEIADISNPDHYGVLHGDLNISNLQYCEQGDHLSVYDTDQVQVGFYLFDVAHACFTIVMLQDGGLPIFGTPVEGTNRAEFIEWIIEGYEWEGQKIDRQRLLRMIEIKKEACIKLARQSKAEGGATPDVQPFLEYIRKHLQPKWKIEHS